MEKALKKEKYHSEKTTFMYTAEQEEKFRLIKKMQRMTQAQSRLEQEFQDLSQKYKKEKSQHRGGSHSKH